MKIIIFIIALYVIPWILFNLIPDLFANVRSENSTFRSKYSKKADRAMWNFKISPPNVYQHEKEHYILITTTETIFFSRFDPRYDTDFRIAFAYKNPTYRSLGFFPPTTSDALRIHEAVLDNLKKEFCSKRFSPNGSVIVTDGSQCINKVKFDFKNGYNPTILKISLITFIGENPPLRNF